MAKEYIERGAVKFAYEMSLKNDTHRTEEASRMHAQEHRHILHLLDKIPAADVVEVVRCVHCKHATLSSIWPPYCDKHKRAVKEEGFCSDGERRDNNA